jgi:hypothetical protein
VSTAPPLDAAQILAVLDRHGVDYVLIGGYAAQLHGSKLPTLDIDVTPATTHDNLVRLAAALRQLQAGIRIDELDHGLPFDTSAEALAGMRVLNLRTVHGDLDIAFEPAGTSGYADLIRAAESRTVGGIDVRVAALPDIIRSKQAAARAKDFLTLPTLERLARERHIEPPGYGMEP